MDERVKAAINPRLAAAINPKLGTGTKIVLCLLGLCIVFDFFLIAVIKMTTWPDNVVSETDMKFLSFTLDAQFMAHSYHHFTPNDWLKFEEYTKNLAPGYLRIGGNAADKIVFGSSNSKDNITLTPDMWIRINQFAERSGFRLLFDLNVLLRNGKKWDSSNAEELIKFTRKQGFEVDFQLGNEPNNYFHRYNITVPPKQLAEDYKRLRQLLDQYNMTKSIIVGPEVTRPQIFNTTTDNSRSYLDEFLAQDPTIDAIGWHQYYVNGRNTSKDDFLNPKIMDTLKFQINIINSVVSNYGCNKTVWMTETGSAYGGGAPVLSNSFISTFFFLDKLGVAAKLHQKVVIRQSLIRGNYALISDKWEPNPDFWIAMAYKQLVGTTVLHSDKYNDPYIRLYIQSASDTAICAINAKPKIVIFGMNINYVVQKNFTVPPFYRKMKLCATYLFKAHNGKLTLPFLEINNQVPVFQFNGTNHIDYYMTEDLDRTLPPLSLGFFLYA